MGLPGAITYHRRVATFRGTERYQLLNKLGQGGMGAVYAVFDTRRQRKVALKVLSDPETGSLYRFKREFRTVADLRHPNLCRLFDLGVLPEGGFFFTMELVEGEDLGAFARRQRESVVAAATVGAQADTVPNMGAATFDGPPSEQEPLEADETARVLADVGAALAFLHGLRKVHRDLKPSNVMVDAEGRAHLLDFGILRELDGQAGLTLNGAVGTPYYMAPEQVAGEPVTPCADLYSFGCMLYELLVGKPPFEGSAARVLMRHLHEVPCPPSEIRPCNPRLEALCLELLAKSPQKRPDAPQTLARLREVAGIEVTPEEVAVPAPRVALIGREPELTRLTSAYERTADGPRVVLIGGESGVGKSALASELAARLEGRAQPWFGSCYEREHVPYKAFDAIVDAAVVALVRRGDDAGRLLPAGTLSLARLFPVLREVAALEQLAPETGLRDPQAERKRAIRAFFALLTNLSGGAAPLLVIDDLQRADADSLAVIRWLCRTPDAPPCLLVATYRTEEVEAGHRMERLLEERGLVEHLILEPLEPEATEALARAHAPETLSATQIARLVEDAQGNPFLAVELARAARDLKGQSLPSVSQLVNQRLANLGGDARAVLEVAAVNGGRAGYELLAHGSGLEARAVADALDELLRVQLLREVAGQGGEDAYDLAHDRLRQAAYAGVTEARRGVVHHALGEFLATKGDAARAVEHWRRAGAPERAREAALLAAEVAEDKLAFDRAAELYELAGEDGGSWELTRARADALRRAGHHGRAAEGYEAALAAGVPADEVRELELLSVTEYLAAGHVGVGLEKLDLLLKSVGTRLERNTIWCLFAIAFRITYLMTVWFVWDLTCRFRPPLAPDQRRQPDAEAAFKLRLLESSHYYLAVQRPLESARLGVSHALLASRYDDPLHQGRARIGYALLLGAAFGPIALGRVHHHLQVGEAFCAGEGDATGLLHGYSVRAYTALLESNWDRIRRAGRDAQALARRAGLYGDPTLYVIESIHVACELFAGDLPAVVSNAELYLRGARERGNLWGLAWPLAILGYTLLLQGEYERGKAALNEALEVAPPEPLTLARAHVEIFSSAIPLVEGRYEEGLAGLADLRRRLRWGSLVVTSLESASLRVQETRLRIAKSRADGKGEFCQVAATVQRFTLPAPSSLRDELLRLQAARSFANGYPRIAHDCLERGIFLAESRSNRFGLGLLLTARARVRDELGLPGAKLDRERGKRLLEEIGAADCFLLRVEGWV